MSKQTNLVKVCHIVATHATIIHTNVLTIVKMSKVYLLDYVAGNIRSLVNAIEKVGYEVEWIKSPDDVQKANVR
jgi:hypothetical protein